MSGKDGRGRGGGGGGGGRGGGSHQQHQHQHQHQQNQQGGYRGGIGDGAGPGGGESIKPSDDPLFFPYTEGEVIAGKYKLGPMLGTGTFSHVIAGTVVDNPEVRVAVKVMKPLSTYIQYTCDARKEAAVLSLLKEKYQQERIQGDQSSRSLHMEEVLTLKRGSEEYVALVMENLECTLYDLVRSNNFLGLHISVVQSIAYQCLQQLQRLHSLGCSHTDIKHKNIMVVREKTLNINQKDCWPVQVQGARTQATFYKHPVESMVRLIDYGNCTHDSESHHTTVHTKHFRAPEIHLRYFPWTSASDLWCLGITLYFAYTGELLFNSHERGTLVSMIAGVLGEIPPHMLGGFNVQPLPAPIPDLYARIHATHRVFAEFLLTLLAVDPAKRATAHQALQHPFFQTQFL